MSILDGGLTGKATPFWLIGSQEFLFNIRADGKKKIKNKTFFYFLMVNLHKNFRLPWLDGLENQLIDELSPKRC